MACRMKFSVKVIPMHLVQEIPLEAHNSSDIILDMKGFSTLL